MAQGPVLAGILLILPPFGPSELLRLTQFHSSFAMLWPCAGATRLLGSGVMGGQSLWQLTWLWYRGMIDKDALESHAKCHPACPLPSTSNSPFTSSLQWDMLALAGKRTELKVRERGSGQAVSCYGCLQSASAGWCAVPATAQQWGCAQEMHPKRFRGPVWWTVGALVL